MDTILDTIIGLMRSKNIPMFNAEDIALFNEFRNLGDNHMEQKSITRLEKLFERAVAGLFKRDNFVESANVRVYQSFSGFRTESFASHMRAYTDENYNYYKFTYKTKTEEDQKAIDWLLAFSKEFSPVADRFYHIKQNQWMRNGKIPKTLQKEVSYKEAIKGKLSPKFVPTVLELVESLRQSEESAWKLRLEKNVKIPFITYDLVGECFYTDDKIKKNVEDYINEMVNKFAFRLSDKLGGFEPIHNILEINGRIGSESNFMIRVTFDNEHKDAFTLHGKSVINTSPLGKPFMQFPITFENMKVNGNKIPEGEHNFKVNFRLEK